MTTTMEDLAMMRDLTRMTGAITNVQKKQLDMWPRVILGADNVKVSVDTKEHVIDVDVSNVDFKGICAASPNESPVDAYERRMAVFNESCKFLLGEEYTVNISMKGQSLKVFHPLAPVPVATHEPRFERPGEQEAYRKVIGGSGWLGIHPKDKKENERRDSEDEEA